MGITGCGKTSFVNLFTDADHKLVVGHGLESCKFQNSIDRYYDLLSIAY
jgi:hypothetical protein